MFLLLASAALIPPPLPGDDRHAVLVAVDRVLDGLTAGNRERLDSALETEGTFTAVDTRKPGAPVVKATTFGEIRAELSPNKTPLLERITNPVVQIRGDIAQVWAPYAFAVNGKPTHCGIDAFHLVRRGGTWRVSGLIYTVESLDQCAALGAPTLSGQE